MAGEAASRCIDVLFLTSDGKTGRFVVPPEIRNVNDLGEVRNKKTGSYMLNMGRVWFVMHGDNDMNLDDTKLPVNQALQKVFPGSRYVGDVMVAITADEDSDDLVPIPQGWTLEKEAENYEVIVKEGQLLFEDKELDEKVPIIKDLFG